MIRPHDISHLCKDIFYSIIFFAVILILYACPFSSPYKLDKDASIPVDETLLGKWSAIIADKKSNAQPVKVILSRKNDTEYNIDFTGYLNDLRPYKVVRNDSIKGSVLVVHAHDDGDVLAFGGGGDDDFLRAGDEVALGLLGFGEEAGGFDDDIHAERLPRQFGGRLGGDDFDLGAIDDEDVIIGLVGAGFLRADGAVETTLGGVVFQEIGEVVRRDDVANRDDFDVLANQTLFHHCAEDEPSDASEAIDCHFHCHNFCFLDFRLNQLQAAHVSGDAPTVNEEFGA